MSKQKHRLPLPFNVFSTISIYNSTKIMAGGDSYRLEQLDPHNLPWRWFINKETEEAVRAFRARIPLRVLAGPAEEIPAGMYIVHDLRSIWAMSPGDFEGAYLSVETLYSIVKKALSL